MKPSADNLERIVDDYLAGTLSLWDFWGAFMNIWGDAELSDEELDRWDQVYEAVYMAAPEPVDAGDRAVGIFGEAELKACLSKFSQKGMIVDGA